MKKNTPNFLRPCTKGKRQHKDMTFWNWGPTTIWHYCMSLILKVKKSLHPSRGWDECEHGMEETAEG